MVYLLIGERVSNNTITWYLQKVQIRLGTPMDVDANGGGNDTYGEEKSFGGEVWKKKASRIKLRVNVRTFKYIPK
jgi:hypothetical protein